MQIVFLDAFTMNHGDLDFSLLESLGDLTVYDRTDSADVISRAKNADIIISNKVIIDRPVFESLPKLRYICVAATGYNNIDLEAATDYNVKVSNVVGYSTNSVAQQAFALMLGLINESASYGKEVSEGKWSNHVDFSYFNEPIFELAGKTLGIYGFGKIGQAVAEIGLAFRMKLIAVHKHPERDRKEGVDFVEFEELIRNSDIISLHAPLTSQNEGLFDIDIFSAMKSNAILINTSRGPVINENDLATALNKGIIKGTGLDVMSKEPPEADNPLLSARNCIITPHHAWASFEARQRLLEGLIDNIKSFTNGKFVNLVN